MNFTAKQIATALGVKRQTIQVGLRDIPPSATVVVGGNEAAAWSLSSLPESLRNRLERECRRQNCRSVESLLNAPRVQWQPPMPLDKIADADIQAATKLRAALLPWLMRQHDSDLSSADLEARGVEEYRRVFGNGITTRYWRELFSRTIRRDNGFEEWNRLEIYLPMSPKAKVQPSAVVSEALAEDFADLENFIAGCINPHDPSKPEREGLWHLAMQKFSELVRAGQSEKSAGRRVRQFLHARAPFLSASRDALRKAFELRQTNGIEDGRKSNGNRAEYPSQDIRRVRHSAVVKNGGRIDAAWREEYPSLSEQTRQRHPEKPRKCPRAFAQMVNREKVKALLARLQGRRTLRRLIGGVTRSAEGIPTMARWAVDDMTSNIEVYFRNPDGTTSLIQPQIIMVMDFASRKYVGWSLSNDKAPTARNVCAAILDGFQRHNVPQQLWVENGCVFGKSLAVNGKEDEQGRTVVAGLAQYGCTIHHFNKMSPTSKGELEKSFDLFQRQMERYPGYTGRNQMLDASEDFKLQQRVIRSGKAPASDYRFSFDEFIRVIHQLVDAYNSTPQFGHLGGLSPNEAFEKLSDPSNPPISIDHRLHWLLASARYRVDVEVGGVEFRHYGRKIQVRGGELPQYVGRKLWAVVDRDDDSMVTFMSDDFRQTFTVETCQQPSADASRIATGSTVLAAELAKIQTHARSVDAEFKALQNEFGNPRIELLHQFRNSPPPSAPATPARQAVISQRMETAGMAIRSQRAAIKAKRRDATVNKSKAQRLGIPAVMVGDDARSRRAIELAEEADREAAKENQ